MRKSQNGVDKELQGTSDIPLTVDMKTELTFRPEIICQLIRFLHVMQLAVVEGVFFKMRC